MLPLVDANGVAINPGSFIALLDGIQNGTQAGLASVSMNTNQRYHEIDLLCQAVNYTGGTGLATTVLTGGGNGALTVSFTSTNGVPGALSIVAAGSGYAANDTFSVTDATGTGGVFKVSTVSGSTVTAAVYNAGTATASPISPSTLLSTLKQSVGGVSMRDIPPLYEEMILQACGINPALGDLPLVYTEPPLTVLGKANTATSWDLAGQSTFQLYFTINSGFTSPSVTGQYVYDYLRNTRTPKGATAPVANLEPVARHLFTFPINASANGAYSSITTLPINYPIRRIWLIGSSAGSLTNVELLADGATRLQATTSELNKFYARYGFKLGLADYTNQNQTAQKTLGYNPLNYFDSAFIFDYDNRYRKALRCSKSLNIRVQSTATQTLTVIMETLPGAYKG
jgi:hypothetical protein